MLCRVLLPVIAISYLICVLFLSGLQKDDLDVSLLKKMQRYNIDFNDLNDKKFREECIKDTISRKSNQKDETDFKPTDKKNKTTEKEYTTTSEYPTTLSVTPKLDTNELQRVLKYLKHKKKSRSPPTTEPNKNNTSSTKKKLGQLLVKLVQESDADRTTRSYDTDTTNHNNNEEPITEHVNKVWQSFDKSEIQTTNNTQNKTWTPLANVKKDNISENTTKEHEDLKDFEQIGKVLAKYLSITFLTSSQNIKNISEPLNVGADVMNQKLATSIAAINALNENIANLQKNINVVQLLSSNISTQSKESMPDIKNAFNHHFTEATNSTYDPRMSQIKIEQSSKKVDGLSVYSYNTVPNNHLSVKNSNRNDQMIFNPNIGMTGTVTSLQTLAGPHNFGQSVIYPTDDFKNTNYQKEIPENHNSPNFKYNAIVYRNKLKHHLAEIQRQSPNCSCETLSENCDTTQTDSESDMKVKGSNALKDEQVLYYYPIKIENVNQQSIDDVLNNKPILQKTENVQIIQPFGYDQTNGLGAPVMSLQEHNKPQYTPKMDFSQDQSPNGIDQAKKIQENNKENLQSIHPFGYDQTNGLGTPVLSQHEHNKPQYTSKIEYSQDQSPNDFHLANKFQENNKPQNIPKPEFFQHENSNKHDETSGLGFPALNLQEYKNIPLTPITEKLQDVIKNITKNKQVTNIPTTESGLNLNLYDQQKGLGAPVLNFKEAPYSSNFTQNKSEDRLKPKQELTNSISYDIIISKIAEVFDDLKKQIVKNATSNCTTNSTTSPLSSFVATSITNSTPTMFPSAISTSRPALVSEVADLVIALNINNTTVPQKLVETKVQLATQAIKKLSQLLEQYKAANETTSNPREKKVKLSGNEPKKKPEYEPINMLPPPPLPLPPPIGPPPILPPPMFPQPMLPPINPYGIRVSPKQASPIYFQHFIPPLLDHPLFSPSYIPTVENGNSITPINLQKSNAQRFPNAVMIQTNTHEIQPLGIPLVKPETMNLNIILTTQNPFWSKDDRDRWNFMFKYGRSPDRIVDIKNTKNSFNAYSNVKVDESAKINSARVINETYYDKLRSNLLKNNYLYNKTDKHLAIIPEVDTTNARNEYNEHETNSLPLLYTIKNADSIVLNQEKVSNDSNYNAHIKRINEIGRYNEELLSRHLKTSLKDSSVNTVHAQFHKDRIPHVHRNPYKIPVGNDEDINAGLMRPKSFREYRTNKQTSHKQKVDGPNRPRPRPNIETSEPYLNHEDSLYDNVYGHEPNDVPVKDMTLYSAQLNTQPLISQPKSRFNQYLKNHKYSHRMPAEIQYNQPTDGQSTDESEASFKHLERYLDTSSPADSIKILEALGNINGREKLNDEKAKRLIYSNMANTKTSVNNFDTQLSSPSDEESNREFKPRKKSILRPHYGNTNRYGNIINSKQEKVYPRFDYEKRDSRNEPQVYPRLDYERPSPDNRNQPQVDLISAMFGHRNERERKYRIDRLNQQYRQKQGAAEGSMGASDNVRGFHEKLEGSDWPDSPSDCGPDEQCMSSVKVFSRHQVPIDAKKPQKYDDSRFQNFLKTQQKVNKMLELILSTKDDGGEPGVETM